MKHFLALVAAAMISVGAFAQLPDGSIAPDWTATDISGNEHNLYALLDSGYQVIIDFSATWCGPCWNYHTSGVLETLYEEYGPNGTNEIRVFFIEGDDTTTLDDLYGTGTSTTGDWTAGTEYPIIDNGGNIFADYACTYYPTIYTICPSRVLTESSQVSVAEHAAIFQASDCQAATLAMDPALLSYNGDVLVCGDAPATLSVELQNMGLDILTSCTIKAFDGGSEIASTDWGGSIETYGIETVVVGDVAFDAVPDLYFEISSGDENADNNSTTGSLALSPESTTYLQVRITTDNWPTETGWVIADDAGNEDASVAVGSLTTADTPFTWDVGLPSTGCYTFTMFDAYGDGLYASQWGNYTDGTAGVYSMDGETEVGMVWFYDGASGVEFDVTSAGMEAATVASVGTLNATHDVRMFPNPTTGNTNLEFTTTQAGMATLEVYNLIGERVMFRTLGNLPAGTNRAAVDFTSMDAGIYLVNVNAGGETTTLRVTKQ